MSLKYPTHYVLGGTAMDGGLEQNEYELSELVSFMSKNSIRSFLEIGIAKGDLQRYMKDLGLDVFGITPDKLESHKGLTVWYGKSQDRDIQILVEAAIAPNKQFDMIFVDGDHSYAAVQSDYWMYKPLCKFMAFHDILGLRDCEGVKRLWNEIKYKYQYTEIIANDKKYASGIGIIKM